MKLEEYSSLNSREKSLRNGLFNMETIRFGKIAEIMIKLKFNYSSSNKTEYDLESYNKDGKIKNKIEVKFSCVREKEKGITEDNALDICMQNVENNIEKRMISFEDRKTKEFDCNIQQIKPEFFTHMYYGLFFADKIVIFKITKNKMMKYFFKSQLSFCRSNIKQIKQYLEEIKSKQGQSNKESYISRRMEVYIPRILDDIIMKLDDKLQNSSDEKLKQFIRDSKIMIKFKSIKEYIENPSNKMSERIDKITSMKNYYLNNFFNIIPDMSSHQHAKSSGEGQFHLKNTNIDWHMKKHKNFTITYAELYNLLDKNRK